MYGTQSIPLRTLSAYIRLHLMTDLQHAAAVRRNMKQIFSPGLMMT